MLTRLHYVQRLTAALLALSATAVAGYGFTVDSLPAPLASAPWQKQKRDVAQVARGIDFEINQRLLEENIPASPAASDSEFCRRVYVDIIGRVPSLDETVAFLDSKQPDKRARLIDQLLASKEYGQHWATIWTNLSVGRSDASQLATPHRHRFHSWLTDAFNAGDGWDTIVAELLSAEGHSNEVPATAFLLSYSGNNMQPQPERITGAVSELFLGIQLKCAECHNHRGPHATRQWKHGDFWAMAAFFTRLRNQRAEKGDNNTKVILTEDSVPKGKALGDSTFNAPRPIIPGGFIEVPDPSDSTKFLPEPAQARFLESGMPNLLDAGPYRPQFAAWFTSPRNPYFARALVNRVWAQLFGRGLITPIDLMHKTNLASHPALLQDLADEFVASGHDLKHLIRALTNSQVYQRSSRALPDNAQDKELLSHMALKPLRPEVLFDSLQVVNKGSGYGPAPATPKDAGGLTPRETFARFFGNQEWSNDPSELVYGIPHYLRLMNVADGGTVLPKLLTQGGDDSKKVIELLYLSALARRPSEAELATMQQYVNQSGDAKVAYGEIYWVLQNSVEFVLNH